MRNLFVALVCSLISSASLAKPIIAQYFGLWNEKGQLWEEKFRDDTPFDKLNRLYVSFAKIIPTADNHFTLEFDSKPERVQAVLERMRKVNPTAEVFATIGGDIQFQRATDDPQFAENVLAFIRQHQLSGVDLDWELYLNRDSLNRLVTALYPVLHANGYKLTLDVWPFVHGAYDMSVLRDNLDQINIMSYGTGLSVETCTQIFVNAGFPINKIIGGIEVEKDYHQFGGVTDSLGQNGTIVAKALYAKTHGLAGMMSWRLGNDYTTKEHPFYPTYQGALELYGAMQNI